MSGSRNRECSAMADQEQVAELLQQHKSLLHWCLKPFRTYKSTRFDMEDLEQVAYMAFLETVANYDESKGQLSTLLAIYVPHRVRRFIRKNVSDFTLPCNGEYNTDIIPATIALDKKSKIGEVEDMGNMFGKSESGYDYADLLADVERACYGGALDGNEVFNQWKLWRLGGYSHKEVADFYGMKRGAVAERLAKVERKLKQQEY